MPTNDESGRLTANQLTFIFWSGLFLILGLVMNILQWLFGKINNSPLMPKKTKDASNFNSAKSLDLKDEDKDTTNKYPSPWTPLPRDADSRPQKKGLWKPGEDTEEDKNHGWAKPNVIDKSSDLYNQSMEFEKIIRNLPDRYKKGYPIGSMNDYAGDDNSLTHSSRMEGKIQANSESWGYVILIESGGHYKIGKSNNYNNKLVT